MVARIWRGVVRQADADEYAEYICRTGMAGYRKTPGNRGAWMLRRDDGDRSEIVTFSLWESREHIKAFAGDDVEQAVFYPEDDRFLVEATSRCATTTSSRSAPSTAPTRRSMRSRCRARDSP